MRYSIGALPFFYYLRDIIGVCAPETAVRVFKSWAVIPKLAQARLKIIIFDELKLIYI